MVKLKGRQSKSSTITTSFTDEVLTRRNRWIHSIYTVICHNIEKRISACKSLLRDNPDNNESIHQAIAFLLWRLGYNLYMNKKFEMAIIHLENTCKGRSLKLNLTVEELEHYLHPDYNVHLYAGRVCVELYHGMNKDYSITNSSNSISSSSSNNHINDSSNSNNVDSSNDMYLKNSFDHYQHALDALEIFQNFHILPIVLHEYARALEYGGDYLVSSDLYSRILSTFINYSGYFDVMYRSALISTYLSYAMEDPSEMHVKINDMLVFLLDALPESIDQMHILFLYAKYLEDSYDATIRYRYSRVRWCHYVPIAIVIVFLILAQCHDCHCCQYYFLYYCQLTYCCRYHNCRHEYCFQYRSYSDYNIIILPSLLFVYTFFFYYYINI